RRLAATSTIPRHDTPPRSRLGPRPRLRPAGALPRGHVLRDLGLAYQQPRGRPRARAVHDAQLAVAAVAAVPGLGRGHGLPAGPRKARCRGRERARALPRTALVAAAGAARVRDAGGGAAAVVLRGGGEAAERVPRRLPGVLGPLPRRRRKLLPGRRLPGAADLEPPVVRRLPLGLHRGPVAAAAPRPGGDRARRRPPRRPARLRP